jgi:hypothetical protein
MPLNLLNLTKGVALSIPRIGREGGCDESAKRLKCQQQILGAPERCYVMTRVDGEFAPTF